jgi:hypothetical protein
VPGVLCCIKIWCMRLGSFSSELQRFLRGHLYLMIALRHALLEDFQPSIYSDQCCFRVLCASYIGMLCIHLRIKNSCLRHTLYLSSSCNILRHAIFCLRHASFYVFVIQICLVNMWLIDIYVVKLLVGTLCLSTYTR